MERRSFLAAPVGMLAAAAAPLSANVKLHQGKPTLFVNGKPVMASFYALTDCTGGRFSFDEQPQQSMRQFAAIGFRLYQVDLWLEDCLPREGKWDIGIARRQLAGVLEACPQAGIVLRWHLNAPAWWREQNPEELTQYDNGGMETPDRKLPVRYLQDDLRRTPRASMASEKWLRFASDHTARLLRELAASPEGNALIGVHVANGVYGEWHYWGFLRNEPDTSAPMRRHYGQWRQERGKVIVAVPTTVDRRALDEGIFRDPPRRETVIDYYRCQQELVADRILHFCELVKRSWPRPIVTGVFYGYFFSLFDRQATGGHLCLDRIVSSPHVDYLSAPQAYGTLFRDPGGSGITRALIETIRLNGKLFLDEMDQTPSWKWRNDVDQAFELTRVDEDVAIIRRNTLEGYSRGAGHWYYDFGPANNSGWWADKRLIAEIDRLHRILRRYHERPYEPAGDVLAVFDTEVFYYTGSIQGTDPLTDPLAVNRTVAGLYQSAAAIETVHLMDLPKLDLSRFRVILFCNTWVLKPEQRKWIREHVIAPGRVVIFQGLPGYCDGQKLSIDFSREVTGLDLRPAQSARFAPALELAREAPAGVRFYTTPPEDWKEILRTAGAHLYTDRTDVIHAGGGLVLLHAGQAGDRSVRFRNGNRTDCTVRAAESVLFDARTGERLL